MMRVIIAGSREFTYEDYELVENVCLSSGYWFTAILSGGAEGVDKLGEEFAKRMKIPIEYFPADWARWGKSAGPKRNEQMAAKAEALILVWDGKSPGSRHMLQTARAYRLLTHVRVAVPTPLMPQLVGSTR